MGIWAEAASCRSNQNEVQDGLLSHLHRQHRNMILMTESFQSIQLGFEQKGINLEPVLPEEEPPLPDFETMLRPSRFANQNAGRRSPTRTLKDSKIGLNIYI